MKKNFKLLILFATALIISLFFYHTSLNYFFFQDDFFEINISKANNFNEYLNFYLFRDDIIAYRPISLQNYFFLSSHLFGLNPVGFRFITLVFFFLSSLIIIKVTQLVTNSSRVAVLASSFWLLSSIHYMAITWIAAAYNIIGTFFWLFTAFLFLRYIRGAGRLNYLLSIIFFLITVGSFEFSVTWPIIWGVYYFYFLKNELTKTLKVFSPFIIISTSYMVLRLFLIKVPQIFEYKVSLNIESLKAFFWYFLWSFNIPEEFKKQVFKNLIFLRPKFLEDYWVIVAVSFISLGCILIIGVIYPIIKSFITKSSVVYQNMAFALFWFCAAISPVLLIPNHTFTMYLILASIGIYIFLGTSLSLENNLGFSLLILAIWAFSSYQTLNFYKSNSWMVESQDFARRFSSGIKAQLPVIQRNSIVLYNLSDHRHRQALLEYHAIRAIYDDPTLLIYYNIEDLPKDLEELKIRGKVYIYSP